MLSVIKLKGGLGNQLFQYAFYLSLKKRHPLTFFLFDNEDTLYCHYGITLESAFGITLAQKGKCFRRLRRHFPIIIRKAHRVEQKNSLQYNEKYLSGRWLVAWYEGYWQSEKYFNPMADEVRKTFRFRENLMNEHTLQMAETLRGGNYVSVHIRRGDYMNLTDYFGLCDISYYKKAIDYFKQFLLNPIFVIFSDDIQWAKDNIQCDGVIFVDWNQETDSWQDMYLMSCCKHNIVANSSFSWWGAWLNTNKDKIVVAPHHWFNYSPNYDIIPEQWILL